jgi:RNA polymerase sigma-70 factor (ECF subfamily)
MGTRGDGVREAEPDLDGAMDRYARGEEAAFELVYDALKPRLVRYVRRHVTDAETAEELVHDAFENMIDARARFVSGARVVPWAYAITRALLIDWYRRAKKRHIQLDPETLGRVPTPEELAQAASTAKRLGDRLRTLPESHRQAFELLKEEGLSLEDAAAVMGTTVMAIKLKSHRARVALRAAIESGEG